MKNKTSLKNKTSKVVGGKKLRSKTNRRKSKSRFSKKTLKRGGKPVFPWDKWGRSKGADPDEKEVDPEYKKLQAQITDAEADAEALVARIKKMHPLNSEGRRLDSKGNIIDSDDPAILADDMKKYDQKNTQPSLDKLIRQSTAKISDVEHILRKTRALDEQDRTPRASNRTSRKSNTK